MNPGIQIVGWANNGKVAVQQLQEIDADVLLIDMEMPVLNGPDTTRLAKRVLPELKVVGLSMSVDQQMIQQFLAAGGNSYVLKHSNFQQIVQAIEHVQRGELFLDPLIAKTILLGNNQAEESRVPLLTRREKEVLQLLADEFTTKEIAKTLFITQSTVEYHRKNLFTKFRTKTAIGLVKKAIEWGLLE